MNPRFVRILVAICVSTVLAGQAHANVLDVGSLSVKIIDGPGGLTGTFTTEGQFLGPLAPVGILSGSGIYYDVNFGPPIRSRWDASVTSSPTVPTLDFSATGETVYPFSGCSTPGGLHSFVGSILTLDDDPDSLVPDDALWFRRSRLSRATRGGTCAASRACSA